ncbi:MAG: hypothetical protein ACRDMZ_13325 [Solirubrobacteraceae bacterium]
MPRLVARVSLLLLVALLAGCGGGDDGPQTKQGFILAADGVCSDVSTELANAGALDPETPKEIAEANVVLADIYGRLARGIADVELPPSGAARRDARAFVRSITAADPLVERLRAVSSAF